MDGAESADGRGRDDQGQDDGGTRDRSGLRRAAPSSSSSLFFPLTYARWQLLCTGQVPNASLMASFCPLAVPGGSHGGGSIKVLRSMQIAPSRWGPSPVQVPMPAQAKSRGMEGSDTQETAVPIARATTGRAREVEACDCATSPPVGGHKRLWDFEEAPDSRQTDIDTEDDDADAEAREISDPLWKRAFAVGDCADAFGAIKAGHTGWNQAEVAAKNVLRLIRIEENGGRAEEAEVEETEEENDEEGGKRLLRYEHRLPMMKLTLGLVRPRSLRYFSSHADTSR